jgi:hypothetical protein
LEPGLSLLLFPFRLQPSAILGIMELGQIAAGTVVFWEIFRMGGNMGKGGKTPMGGETPPLPIFFLMSGV